MWSRRNLQAFSLMEAILSTFLLLSSLLLSIYVFHSSLRAEVGNEKRVVAAAVAEAAMAEARQMASDNFPNLLTEYTDRQWRPDEAPEFLIRTRARRALLGLACLELESQYPRTNRFPDEPEPRMLENSAVDLEMEVSWNDPTPRSIVLTERVANLRQAPDFEVRLLDDASNPVTATDLARGAITGFRARAFLNDQPVNDLQFTWYVQPVTGFGSLHAVSRDGLRCEYRNAYRNFNNRLRYAPGVCFLTVTATFQGRTATDRVRINNES